MEEFVNKYLNPDVYHSYVRPGINQGMMIFTLFIMLWIKLIKN